MRWVERSDFGGKLAALALAVAAATTLLARRWYLAWKLDFKLQQKRQDCERTLQLVKQQLQQAPLDTEEAENILSLPLSTLVSQIHKGVLKSLNVLKAYQDKALAVNTRLNCVVEAITEAQNDAGNCDKMADSSRLLLGVPLSLKENIGIKGYDTTAGLQVNINKHSPDDAVVVQVFKRHGAIPFIRTNIPQAMLSYTCSNPIFGITLNPHNLKRGPGGSSGGEAAAIAAGASVIGLGTDVGGSVRLPAAFCGICALKTTLGRFSKHGIYSVIKGQNLISGVVGPLARDVDSLVLMTRVLTSSDMFDLDPTLPVIPFQEKLLMDTHKLKIGYYTWDGVLPCTPVVKRAVMETKKLLEDNGHTLVEFNPPDAPQTFFELFLGSVVGADRGETLQRVAEVTLEKVITVSGSCSLLVRQGKGDKLDVGLRLLPYFKLPTWILSLVAAVLGLQEPVMGKMLRNIKKDGRTYSWFMQANQIQEYRTRFIKLWQRQGLDAVICPAFPSPAPYTEDVGHLLAAGSYVCLYNVVNFPAGVLPVTKVTTQDIDDAYNPEIFSPHTPLERLLQKSAGSKDSIGLPVGVQCVAFPYREELCLRLMLEIEAAVNYKDL